MKILVLSQYFWPEHFIVNDLARQLSERGHEVEILTGLPNYPHGSFFEGYSPFRRLTERFDGLRVLRVPLWPRRQGGALNLILNYGSFVVSASTLGLWRLKKRPDVIFVFAPSPIIQVIPALILGRLTGRPVALWIQDLWPESLRAVGAVRSPKLLGLVGKIVAWLYRRCDLLLIQSEAFRKSVRSLTAGMAKIEYLPNWAEPHYGPVTPPEDFLGRKEMPTGFKVVFAGNLGKAQSLETILDTAQILSPHSEIQWVFIGDGRERQAFASKVESAGLSDRFHFLGKKPSESMPSYLALADVLLVTLRNDPAFSETIPSRVQAFLACGKPLAAALNGEGRRVIEEAGAGFTTEAESAEGLAEAIRRIYQLSQAERTALGEAGVRYSRAHFDRSRVISKLEGFLWTLAKPEAN